MLYKTSQKEIKNLIKSGVARDITVASDSSLKQIGRLEKVSYSHGTYGINGAVFRDKKGKLYAVKSRAGKLFKLW